MKERQYAADRARFGRARRVWHERCDEAAQADDATHDETGAVSRGGGRSPVLTDVHPFAKRP